MNAKRLDLVLLCALCAFALLLRVGTVATHSFDGLYGQDAFAYYDFAVANAQGHPPSTFFWPLGYPALLTAGFWWFGTSPTVAQAISILLGALLSPCVYLLARQMNCGRVGACLAGLLMAVCGQAVQSSIVVMADIPALAWVMVSALCLWRYKLNPRDTQKINEMWLTLSAVTLALACVTRWLCLIFVPLWGVTYLLAWGRTFDLKRRWRELLTVAAAALVVFIPQMFYSRTNPYPTLNHAWVQGWSPVNMLAHDFTNADGYLSYPTVNAVFYAQVFYAPYYLAPVWTPFIILGVIGLAAARQFRKLWFLAGWALLPYTFLIGIPLQNIRFPLIVFPAVAVLVGAGISHLWSIKALIAKSPSSLDDAKTFSVSVWLKRLFLACVLFFGMRQTYADTSSILSDFITRQQADRATAAWVARYLPADARLYTFGMTQTLRHYTTLEVRDLYYETPETLRAGWRPDVDDYLLINTWSIMNQWAGREPQIAANWLLNARGLQRIGRYGSYTLYRVHG